MEYYKCRKCPFTFDVGDLIGGVCEECRKKEESQEISKEYNQKMLVGNNFVKAGGERLP